VKLDIASNEHLTNETLKQIGLHGTNLENLNILKCTLFDERGIVHLSSCSKLKKLNMGMRISSFSTGFPPSRLLLSPGWCKLNDETLYKLAQKCTKLEALDVWLLRGVTTAGLQRVAGLLTGIKKLNLWAVKVRGKARQSDWLC
jgi:F-box and leucine-rich repeat protein 2/20